VTGIVLHVRQGFETDAGKELSAHLKTLGISCRLDRAIENTVIEDSAIVIAQLDVHDFKTAFEHLKFENLIFARQLLWMSGKATLPVTGDRASVLVEALTSQLLPMTGCNAFSGLHLETPDTDLAKELSGFCKSLTRPIESALNKRKLLPKGKGASHLPRAHLVMVSNVEVLITYADPANSSPWPMGIPRLKFPPQAPSRSTLKLEEAFWVFLGKSGMENLLRPGMTAADLGACPGGWTFQLVKHGIHTMAVDNGAIDPNLMTTGLVTHYRDDAFRFRPHETLDWMVCDVVEQPSRITDLVCDWFIHGHCRRTIFNLKLPMKKRFEEVEHCLASLQSRCASAGLKLSLKAKQLYHDRKEITVFAALNS
jgi:23S rRNA (cytidine2498-2'-O)-methyltransferase